MSNENQGLSTPMLSAEANKIAAKIAERAIDRLLTLADDKIRGKWAKYQNLSKASFSKYIQKQRVRCELVRTLIYTIRAAI